MHSGCQFDKMKTDMKRTAILTYLLLILFPFMPAVPVFAETKINPDVRTSNIHVKKRLMPQTCGYTLEEWIEMYVGYNKIVSNKIKFYTDLIPDANGLDKTTMLLTPQVVLDAMLTPKDEAGNKPSWNASICYYSDAGNGQIPSGELIIAEGAIPEATKKLRWGAELLAAELTRATVHLTGDTYDMKQPDIAPDTSRPRSCSETPPGVSQTDIKDTNKGLNPFNFNFVNDYTLDAICSLPGNPCQCVMTDMWIKPDSTNQYASYTGCTLAGCKYPGNTQTESQANSAMTGQGGTSNQGGIQQAVLDADPASRADDNAINSGGIANIFRPSIMQILFDFVEKVIGNSIGIVKNQSTENKQGVRVEPASWSFTKEWEVSMDFIYCKLSPFILRSDMPECNTNWLANLIENVTNQLIVEPADTVSTESAIFHAP